MGCASAYRLARSGLRVTVLERSVPGAEASSAAAGILGARVEAHDPGPLTELFAASRALFPALSRELSRSTGIDIEYRECGVLRVAFQASEVRKLAAANRFQAKHAKVVSKRALAALEPALSPKLAGGVHFTDDARVVREVHAASELGAQRRLERGERALGHDLGVLGLEAVGRGELSHLARLERDPEHAALAVLDVDAG